METTEVLMTLAAMASLHQLACKAQLRFFGFFDLGLTYFSRQLTG
jgi:hypothetical protein